MLEVLLKDDNWFLPAAGLSLTAAFALIVVARRRRISGWIAATGACNLFFGLLVGILGTGRLFGVTTKAVLGILPPVIHLWFAIPFGFALAVPASWLALQVGGLVKQDVVSTKRAIWLNVWLALVLASAGPAVVLAGLAGIDIVFLMLELRARRRASAS